MNLRIENYCHLLNITNAILSYTSKYYYKYIECQSQSRETFCNNINELFSDVYIIPNPSYIKIVNLLERSLMNTLECSKYNNKFISNKTHILYFNSDIIYIIIIAFLLAFSILYINKTFKKKKY